MSKYANDAVMDAALSEVAKATTLTVCTQQPTSRTEAVTTYALATATLTAGDGNGDYTIADASGGGRQVTVAQQSDMNITTSGTATHVALCDATRLLYVTTCNSQALTDTGTVTAPSWTVTFGDPS